MIFIVMYIMKNFNRFVRLLCLFSLVALISACDLEQNPVSTTGRDAVFGSESGLQLYAQSFYDELPSANNIVRGDRMSDYAAIESVPSFILAGAYDETVPGGWHWAENRNINYFLTHNNNPDIPQEVRNHYNGIAKFFRARFYFEKVKKFGDVNWINEPLDPDDPRLDQPRDPRAMVMDSVLADINYAIENIREGNDNTRTTITRDVALALKSRIALFEGTFRKYHPDFGLQDSADEWLQEAVFAAEQLIQEGNYSLYTGSGEDLSYRRLFTSNTPVSDEVILANVYDVEQGVLHNANWWYTSGTFGDGLSFVRPFINTYLNRDGTPFTNRNGHETESFAEETQNRDLRLQQTIRLEGYTRISGGQEAVFPPDFSYTTTGYHPIKWTVDDSSVDGGTNNTNVVPLIRYAEILLNYAEAKAELGTITDADWSMTIGALRERAGITGGLHSVPTDIDPYLQETYFPDISDPVLLEVRRERGIELVLEGFRFEDVRRWRRGELMEMPWLGFYVDEADEYIDLMNDGEPDVYFHTTNIAPFPRTSGVDYVNISSGRDMQLTNEDNGEILWLDNQERRWEDKMYLDPISIVDLERTPALEQNPGW